MSTGRTGGAGVDAPTVAAAIHDAARHLADAGINDSRLEAEVVLAHALNTRRAHLLAELRSPMTLRQSKVFEALLGRRLGREPLAYVLGRREFYGIDMLCTHSALIPRPETEMLVEIALTEIRARGEGARIADIGTGSGAIAIAICANAPGVKVAAVDRAEAACQLARENISRQGLNRQIEVRRGDLLEGSGVFDVIVANLPYVSEPEWRALPPEIRDHEPRAALVGGARGTEVIEELLGTAPEHLAPGGVLAAEIGDTQGVRLGDIASRFFPRAAVEIRQDLAGLDRALLVRRVAQ